MFHRGTQQFYCFDDRVDLHKVAMPPRLDSELFHQEQSVGGVDFVAKANLWNASFKTWIPKVNWLATFSLCRRMSSENSSNCITFFPLGRTLSGVSFVFPVLKY